MLLRQPFPNASAPRLHKWLGIFSVRPKGSQITAPTHQAPKAPGDLGGRRVVAQVVEPKTFISGALLGKWRSLTGTAWSKVGFKK